MRAGEFWRKLKSIFQLFPGLTSSTLERGQEKEEAQQVNSTMWSLLLTMTFILTQKQVIKSCSNADWGEDQVGFGFWTFKIAVHSGGEFSEGFLHDCSPWSAVWIQTGLPWVGVAKAAGWRRGYKIKQWEKVTLIRKIGDFIPKRCDLRYKNTVYVNSNQNALLWKL